MSAKKKKQTIGVINPLELMKRSPNKMNASMAVVRQGAGVHQDKTKYNRKRMKQGGFADGYHCISDWAV